MKKRSKKLTRDEVDYFRQFALRVLGDTREGEVFEALMNSPHGANPQRLRDLTSAKRCDTVEKIAKELVRRGLAMSSEDVPAENGGSTRGYRLGSITFMELWY